MDCGMDRCNRIVLKDDAGLGKVHRQLVHVGLRFLAMGALEVGELDQLQILGGRAAIGAVGVLLQLGAILGKGMLAKGNNGELVAGDDVLAVGERKELKRGGLLLAGLVADENDHLADAFDRSLEDGLHLPDAALVVAPAGLQEGIDGFLGGQWRR